MHVCGHLVTPKASLQQPTMPCVCPVRFIAQVWKATDERVYLPRQGKWAQSSRWVCKGLLFRLLGDVGSCLSSPSPPTTSCSELVGVLLAPTEHGDAWYAFMWYLPWLRLWSSCLPYKYIKLLEIRDNLWCLTEPTRSKHRANHR